MLNPSSRHKKALPDFKRLQKYSFLGAKHNVDIFKLKGDKLMSKLAND